MNAAILKLIKILPQRLRKKARLKSKAVKMSVKKLLFY